MNNRYKHNGNAGLLILVVVIIAAVSGWFVFTQSVDVENNESHVEKYQQLKVILDPVFTEKTSFDSFRKDVVRDKIRLALDYVYERLKPILEKDKNSQQYQDEIIHYLQNKQLTSEELSSVKKYVYETHDNAKMSLNHQLFKEHKEVYIFLAYERLFMLLKK